MGSVHENIEIIRGDTTPIRVKVTSGGKAVTPATAILTCRKELGATSSLFAVSEFTKGTDGSFTITIPPETTADLSDGSYYYDIQITTSDGGVYTVAHGRFRILMDCTYATDTATTADTDSETETATA